MQTTQFMHQEWPGIHLTLNFRMGSDVISRWRKGSCWSTKMKRHCYMMSQSSGPTLTFRPLSQIRTWCLLSWPMDHCKSRTLLDLCLVSLKWLRNLFKDLWLTIQQFGWKQSDATSCLENRAVCHTIQFLSYRVGWVAFRFIFLVKYC